MKILANSRIRILFEIRMYTGTQQTLIVSHLTQQLDGMQQLRLPTETLIKYIQNYILYVLSAINGLQETTGLRELRISELFFVLRI